MSKIRLAGGPFGGKVIDHPNPGINEIVMRGKKRMSRAKQYELAREAYSNPATMLYRQPVSIDSVVPQVEARYRIAMRVQNSHTMTMNMPCMHPDGSLFYEYVEGSKREMRNY
jgi:hypothetical protein